MVTLLVAEGDPLASADLARLFDTRTLHSTQVVCDKNLLAVARNVLNGDVQVVIPTNPDRWTDPLVSITIILEKVGRPPLVIGEYMKRLNASPPVLPGSHARVDAGGVR